MSARCNTMATGDRIVRAADHLNPWPCARFSLALRTALDFGPRCRHDPLVNRRKPIMHKGRIEAFSDGVLAIIITIMVLELKVPHGHDFEALKPLIPIFFSYVLSFANVGIYWNNHHHMFQAVKHVGGWVLWANLHLLFWLSLMPFATAFMGENGFASATVALYAFDLFMCAVAYTLLVIALLAEHGRDSDFARALGADRKGKISLAVYALAMPLAYVQPILALICLAIVALIWIVPDRRFARAAH